MSTDYDEEALRQPHASANDAASMVLRRSTTHAQHRSTKNTDCALGRAEYGQDNLSLALRVAMLYDSVGAWKMVGRDDLQPESVAFLAQRTADLLHGKFPEGTEGKGEKAIWTISGTLIQDRLSELIGTIFNRPSCVSFDLYIQDYAGIILSELRYGDKFWDDLVHCDGFIYLYDPLLDGTDKTNSDYFQQGIDFVTLALQKHHSQAPLATILPHYVAVCITKFDHPDTFKRLDDAGLVVWDATSAPWVPDAAAAFRLLANKLVISTIERSFRPSHIRYFVTSSVGFYEDAAGHIDREDLYHVVLGENRLRSEGHPINVFEPLIWIAGQLWCPSIVRAMPRSPAVLQKQIRKIKVHLAALLADLRNPN